MMKRIDFSDYMTENFSLKHKLREKTIMDQAEKQKSLWHKKLYIKHGIKVTKLHTVYQFRQPPWLAKDEKYNADQRTKAKTTLEKLFLTN